MLPAARVVARRPLLYSAGADPALDCPAHVRAGSALVWTGRHFAIVQDDTCFVAFVDGDRITALPYGTGVRQFDDSRGNKKQKLDLEAAFVDGDFLLALGSGSSPLRERVVVTDLRGGEPRIAPLPDFYALLRRTIAFSGSELNLEGAVSLGDDLVLLQRGNGAGAAIDATARIDRRAFLAHLDGGPCPALANVVAWDLGAVDGHRLTFTDGTAVGDRIAFLACAEDSPDATKDGPVAAVALGILDDRARTHAIGLVLDEQGAPLLDKAEGLAFEGERAFVVTDRDDPNAPAELLELALGDRWRTGDLREP